MYLQGVNADGRFNCTVEEIDACPVQIQGPKSKALMKDLLEFMPVFETEFVEKKPKNPLKPLQQLSYVLPKPALHLLPENIRTQLLFNYPEWYNTDCEFQWEFCKYFWESHAIMKTIKLDKLKEIIV